MQTPCLARLPFLHQTPTIGCQGVAISMPCSFGSAESDLGFGISQGYATWGQIGFAERMDYTAIGTVTNLAARLCSEAKDGQILVSGRIAAAVEGTISFEDIRNLPLKGHQPARSGLQCCLRGHLGQSYLMFRGKPRPVRCGRRLIAECGVACVPVRAERRFRSD